MTLRFGTSALVLASLVAAGCQNTALPRGITSVKGVPAIDTERYRHALCELAAALSAENPEQRAKVHVLDADATSNPDVIFLYVGVAARTPGDSRDVMDRCLIALSSASPIWTRDGHGQRLKVEALGNPVKSDDSFVSSEWPRSRPFDCGASVVLGVVGVGVNKDIHNESIEWDLAPVAARLGPNITGSSGVITLSSQPLPRDTR